MAEHIPVADAVNPPQARAHRRRPRVLVFAYACEPGRGSEPGAGWGLVRAISTFADCTVLVAPEHISAIRRWQASTSDTNIEFVEVPERWFVRPSNRHRLTRFVLYMAWLRRARAIGAALHRERRFDATWHATYSTYWLPTPAVQFGVPTVWGPVGGAVTTPWRLWPVLGWRGLATELFEDVSVRALALLPATRRTWQRACVRVVQNEETLARLPTSLRADTLVLNHAVLTEPALTARRPRGRHCLFVGALERRKGAALAIRALARASEEVSLRIVGDGPDRRHLAQLAKRLGVTRRVQFEGRATRAQIACYLAEAAAVIYTGLREEGGLALAEALLAGSPVVVLANGGARTVASAATDSARVALIEPGRVDDVAERFAAAMVRFVRRTPDATDPMLPVATATETLRSVFLRAVSASGATEPTDARPCKMTARSHVNG
jgi:glycosyltransferase involved in cell wall biosynthesis